MNNTYKHHGYFTSVLSCRCPRCREGKLFANPVSARMSKNMAMNKNCLVCGQPTELEVGFYYGTSYVSYGNTVLLSLISLAIWWFTIGLSAHDNRFFWWLGINAVILVLLQPFLMRLSRSIWIAFFVRYDKDWREHQPEDPSERLNTDQGNNW